MDLKLPTAIANYFATDNSDGEAIALCFTEHAIVKDEERTHTGRDAIRAWVEDTSREYQFTSQPFAAEELDGRFIVTSKVSGTFPGSPVDLVYTFGLEGNLISFLEIVG